MQRSPERSGRKGFTLIEMLVVIGIIVILASMLTPAVITAMRKAHIASTANLLHQVEIGAQAFMNDYGDYPPSTWAELDEMFRYDSDNGSGGGPDGTYNRADDEVFFAWNEGPGGGPPTLDPTTADLFGNPIGITTYNEGNEVLTACLASQRQGSTYLDLDAGSLGNTDGDFDQQNHVATMTNWSFFPNSGGDPIFEIIDFWGNPIVYVHNRHYAEHDGWMDPDVPAFMDDDEYFEVPDTDYTGWAAGDPLPERMLYVDRDGNLRRCYASSWVSHYDATSGNYIPSATGNYPKLNDFQLYSWGIDEFPGCDQAVNASGVALTDTNGNPYPDPDEVNEQGDAAGEWAGWNADSGKIMNWQE